MNAEDMKALDDYTAIVRSIAVKDEAITTLRAELEAIKAERDSWQESCQHQGVMIENAEAELKAVNGFLRDTAEDRNRLEAELARLKDRVAGLEGILQNLSPENAIDDGLLRDIHYRLQVHGERYPERAVSVLHRNVVLYTIHAAISALFLTTDNPGGDTAREGGE